MPSLRDARSSPVVREVVVPFVAHRLALTGFALALLQFMDARSGFHTYLSPAIDIWVRWDAVHYMRVANEGYGGLSDGFFPLFPVLIRGLSWAMPIPLAGFIVANAAALGALVLLHRWLRSEHGADIAQRAVWMALTFPTSFYLSAVYSESTYLLFALATVLAWRNDKYAWACVWVTLACLARPQGFVTLTIPFVLGWLLLRKSGRRLPWFVLGSIPALGLLMGAHYLGSGDPFGFLHAGTVQRMRLFWDNAPEPPPFWRVLWDEGLSANLCRRLLNWSALAYVLGVTVHCLRHREVELGAITVLTMALPFVFHASLFDAASMARYALIAFPGFLALARWLPEGRGGRLVPILFAMAQTVLFCLFAGWFWAE